MSQKRQALYEANQYMATVLKLVSLILIVVIMIYSDNPWISTPIHLLMPIIGVGSTKLAVKYNNLIFFPFLTNPLILFFLMYYSGVNSPGWMQSFTILTGAFFMLPKRVHHIFLFIYVLAMVSLANLLIGQTLNISVTNFVTVLVVGILLERSFNYLILQQKKINDQKQIIENKQKEISDSINYAERIQRSFLATKELLDRNLNEYFVFFQPKDVVSGDFYWARKLNNGCFAIVTADSTGHGVPGAIMSILNISSIEKAVEQNLCEPTDIFNATRRTIIERLKKDGSPEGGKDGMDASIICFDFLKNKFTYVAAQNPIWIIRNGEFIEIKPEKIPVGKHDKDNLPFVGGGFEIQKGDQIYTLTDGFQDQFGGPKGKKFMVKKMREYLISISHLCMREQHQKLKDVFFNWKGELEQVDDVCIIGVRISEFCLKSCPN